MDDKPYEAYAIIPLLYKHRKPLLIVLAIAFILSVGITFIMPSKYKATGIVFPPQANDLQNAIENPQMGYDVAADRLIQLLESQQMRDAVVRETGLLTYYDIDTTKQQWSEQLNKKYFGDIQINRTRYMSVVVTATLKDPELAAQVVNTCIDQVNTIRKNVFLSSLIDQKESMDRAVEQQTKLSLKLGDSVIQLGQMPGHQGLIWLYNRLRFQGEQIIERDAVQELANETPTLLLDPRDELLVMDYVFSLKRLERLQQHLVRLDELLTQPVPGVYVVDRARPSYERTGPSLILNALAGVLGAFIIMVIMLMIQERFKVAASQSKA